MSTSGGAGLVTALKTLTGAELIAAHTVPAEWVPAPGANRVIVPQFFTLECALVTTVYAGHIFGAWDNNSNLPAIDMDVHQPSVSGVGPTFGIYVVSAGSTTTGENTADISGKNFAVAPGTITSTGSASAITIANGGAGYVANDTGTIDGAAGTKATYKVLTVGALGIVTSIQLVTGGAAIYDTASNPVTTTDAGAQPGIGTGLTVNVTSIVIDGTFYLGMSYTIRTTH